MNILSNTSPLCYLILLDYIHLVPELLGEILIPDAVQYELLHESVDDKVRSWISKPPAWATIYPSVNLLDDLPNTLGAGERAIISLAVALQSRLVIIDDLDARVAAQNYRLTVTGTLGILYRAGTAGLLDFPTALERLQQTSFRVSPKLANQLLLQYKEQRKLGDD